MLCIQLVIGSSVTKQIKHVYLNAFVIMRPVISYLHGTAKNECYTALSSACTSSTISLTQWRLVRSKLCNIELAIRYQQTHNRTPRQCDACLFLCRGSGDPSEHRHKHRHSAHEMLHQTDQQLVLLVEPAHASAPTPNTATSDKYHWLLSSTNGYNVTTALTT